MNSLEARNVTLAAADRHLILDDVSLSVAAGSTLVICGPAGAGKTALLRVLVGLDDADDGDVLIDDVLVNAVRPRDRDIAMTFADHALHPHLDVWDNLAFSSRLRKGYDADALDDRVEEVAELLALSPLLDLRPDELDDAQQQRVAIGRSLVRDALAHLFDEAFAAQPDRVRNHLRSVTTEWQTDRGRTTIFTTSDASEALSLADRVAVMHQGVVHQVGSPRELYERPADLVVAGFLGEPAMNLVPARPSGQSLILPMCSLPMDDGVRRRVADRDLVLVGLRPEQLIDATTPAGHDVRDRVELTARVDDVEWRGRSRLVYLGFEMDEEVEARLEGIEDDLDLDLFQNFVVVDLPADSALSVGMTARVVAPRQVVHVFDPDTGENLASPTR